MSAAGTSPPRAVSPISADQAPLLARSYYADGAPSPIVAALAHVPELLDVAMPFVAAALGESFVSARLKEIAILRASAVLGCHYCVRSHTVVALDEGLSRAEVVALCRDEPAQDAFDDERERALVAWVQALAGGRGPLDGDLERHMAACFSEAEIVELTVVATATMMLNRFCTALGLPVSDATLVRLRAEGLL